jgi:AcrR family transcriptional regulator
MDRQPDPTSEDHRTRVAAERRERMHSRLVQSALLVFGQRGVDASIIDELISTAGVSRGTFYNYFRTNEDVLIAVSVAVSNEMLRVVDPFAHAEPDPAARIAVGMRLFLGLAEEFPAIGAFLSRGGVRVLTGNGLINEYLPRDLIQGRDSGRFQIADVAPAFDMVVGSVLTTLHRMQSGGLPDGHLSRLASMVLLALGLTADEAQSIAQRPLLKLELPPDSLLARAGGGRK